MADRRDFLKTGASAAAFLGGAASFPWLFEAAAPPPPDLALAHGGTPEKATRAAVDALGGMKRFVSRGDVVVVKPNIGWDRTPEQAANTNPLVVATLVVLCLEAGAKKVKVFDRPCNDPRRCYEQSGIAPLARRAGAEVSFVDERRFKEKALNGEVLKSWPLYEELLEADKVINVPIAKHHGLAGLTLGIKNWMGIMGGSRGRIHQNLSGALPDLAAAVKPCLTVLDAVRVLTAHGPQGGDLADVRKLDTVAAGVDMVAVDALGATLMGKSPADVGYIRGAASRGLGTMNLEKVTMKRIEL